MYLLDFTNSYPLGINNMYDFLIVGSGLFGSVCARQLTDSGKKCLVIDRRNHIAGNCYDVLENGIYKSIFGGHYFHCNNKQVWAYINRFSEFIPYSLIMKANYKDTIYSYPINLMTMHQLWGIKTPEEARKKINEVKLKIDEPRNFEEKVLSLIGKEIYEKFFYGYNLKHWGRNPARLPVELINRIVIRYNYDDRYFNDYYQGIPKYGYTKLFENLLSGIEVKLNTPHHKSIRADKVIYTGSIDEFYGYRFGKLEYRGTEYTYNNEEIGSPIITHPDKDVPFTRKFSYSYPYFNFDNFITATETSLDATDNLEKRAYPINDMKNYMLFSKYVSIKNNKVYFGGRLGYYKYLNMDKIIEEALAFCRIIT